MSTKVLDDLVALLLDGQAPFGDAEFIEAARSYRDSAPAGKMARKQVNLAACLYLSIRHERITDPRVRELGGWGQRNHLLQDIEDFVARGARPTSASGRAQSLVALGGPSENLLQIAIEQGLQAAHKALEGQIRAEAQVKIDEAQRTADQRVSVAEQLTRQATELKEVAQAQSRMLEHKFDQQVQVNTRLAAEAAQAVAQADERGQRLEATLQSLTRLQAELAAARSEVAALQDELKAARKQADATHREQMLALDRARHANDQALSSQQAEISRLGAMLEEAQKSGREHALAARSAQAQVGSIQAELAAATEKIAAQQEQIVELRLQIQQSSRVETEQALLLGALSDLQKEVAALGQKAAVRESDPGRPIT